MAPTLRPLTGGDTRTIPSRANSSSGTTGQRLHSALGYFAPVAFEERRAPLPIAA
jgi:hypothetical protein